MVGMVAAPSVALPRLALPSAPLRPSRSAHLNELDCRKLPHSPCPSELRSFRPSPPTAQRKAARLLAASGTEASSMAEAATAAAVPLTQQGWTYSEYGAGDVLKFSEELSVPAVRADQVLIRVGAAALNPVDFKRRQGKFQATDSPLPHVPGYDVAGVVVAVGADVTQFQVGDEVYSDISEAALNLPKQFGSLAQYTATEAHLVALKPRNLSFLEAAAVPLAALTAQEGFERAEFKEGQTVLILNGAGGVGTFAVQLAKHVFKAGHVAATCSAGKAELVKSLGADHTIDYKTEKYWELEQKFDFVLDCIGDGPNAVKALKPEGKALCLTGPLPEGGQAERYVLTSSGLKLAQLTTHFESGVLRPVLDPSSPFAFSKAREAFAFLESGHASGKVVVGPIY